MAASKFCRRWRRWLVGVGILAAHTFRVVASIIGDAVVYVEVFPPEMLGITNCTTISRDTILLFVFGTAVFVL